MNQKFFNTSRSTFMNIEKSPILILYTSKIFHEIIENFQIANLYNMCSFRSLFYMKNSYHKF